MRNMLTKRAGVLLAIIIVVLLSSSGCGGGGSSPVIPQPDDVLHRLLVIDGPNGGQFITEKKLIQGEPWKATVRLEEQDQDQMGSWTLVSGEFEISTAVEGIGSGAPMADIGLSGTRFILKQGQSSLELAPPLRGDTGIAKLILFIEELDVEAHLWIDVQPGGIVVPPPPACEAGYQEIKNGHLWVCQNGILVDKGEACSVPGSEEIRNGRIYRCQNGVWTDIGPVNPPSSNDLVPVQGTINCFDGTGLQSVTLEVKPPSAGVGFILWEIPSGPSGAFTVPIGNNPCLKCEFYYELTGDYSVRATPYGSEKDYQDGKPSIGEDATFLVHVT